MCHLLFSIDRFTDRLPIEMQRAAFECAGAVQGELAALRDLAPTARACRRSPELRRSLEGLHDRPLRLVKLISLGRRWALLCRLRAQARKFEGPRASRELSSLSSPRESSHRRYTRCQPTRAHC